MDIIWTQQQIETFGEHANGGDYEAYYINFAISHDGLSIIIGDLIYGCIISRDGGATWVLAPIPEEISAIYPESVLAANGGFIAMVGSEALFYVYNWDTSSWDSYSIAGVTRSSWYSACSLDGQYIAIGYGGEVSGLSYINRGVYQSDDYGQTWVRTLLTDNDIIYAIGMSEDGATILASVYIASDPSTNIYASYNYGDSFSIVWSEISPTEGNIYSLDVDSSGLNMVAFFGVPNNCLVSSDGGTSWARKAIGSFLYDDYLEGSISRDGTRLIFAHYTYGVWVSSDFGDTWTEVFPAYPAGRISGWKGAQFDGASNTNIAFVNINTFGGAGETSVISPICMSYDFGVTWDYVPPYAGWQTMAEWSVATDATGDILLAASGGGAVNPYMSHDSGATWVACNTISGSSGENINYASASISTDGNYMLLLHYLSRLFTSSNSGASWNEASLPGIDPVTAPIENGIFSAMSSDGKYMVACFRYYSGGFVYLYFISKNYGVDWQTMTTPVNFTMFAIDETGALMVGATTTAVYTSTDYGDSFINVTADILAQTGVTIHPSFLEISSEETEDGSCIYIADSSVGLVYSTTGGTVWIKLDPSQYAIIGSNFGDITSSYNGASLFFTNKGSTTGEVFISTDYAIGWVSSIGLTNNSNNIFLKIDSNESGVKLIGSTYQYVYYGLYSKGRIKSIAGILLENIAKVGGISIDDLKKISGEEN